MLEAAGCGCKTLSEVTTLQSAREYSVQETDIRLLSVAITVIRIHSVRRRSQGHRAPLRRKCPLQALVYGDIFRSGVPEGLRGSP
jgi:hypothetical protein